MQKERLADAWAVILAEHTVELQAMLSALSVSTHHIPCYSREHTPQSILYKQCLCR